MSSTTTNPRSPHRVVIIGSGFGGLFAARALRKARDVKITLVSATTHHLFQPLLYQVATGILSEGLIAPATREVLARQENVEVVFGKVTDIDLARRTVTAKALDETQTYDYDSLIVAAGAGQSYFGNDEFARHAPGMKSIDDALELRGRIFGVFELAELAAAAGRADDVRKLMTFVVVGAGPTGVEMAGQISELSRRTLRRDFRNIDPTSARIILLDAAPAVLSAFGDRLGNKATERLKKMGVEVELGAKVVGVDATGIEVEDAGGAHRRIDAICKVWAAGVSASPLGKQLAEQSGAQLDRAGRIKVEDDLTLPGHPEVFVVGDMISLKDYPGVAQLAIQGGRYAARAIRRRLSGEKPQGPFEYFDKGSMATISRFSAVASIGKLRFSGFVAWVLWLGVHLVYIIGFKSRVTTLLHWAVAFLGRARGERTSTEQQIFARLALERLGDDFTPSVNMGVREDQRDPA
ncbi:NADH dehydrogenase [Barrientosiimonas humi]|uniref:NADH:ubiquinone reductase (non-electrogenic) n=1 Tax=Barrientosiimonas humi TaxID=999931 RepID=A0A542X992_9MICO|nr:NAD(P)/FAD-dependent oxidoreductase [Barrientosiimonas humi]TQL32413.1 NADH dehydrogenase [Barrientosiimonas humi]CAG7572404.1 NADH dehydrogenase-like protein [Barrientosiimonas humi]